MDNFITYKDFASYRDFLIRVFVRQNKDDENDYDYKFQFLQFEDVIFEYFDFCTPVRDLTLLIPLMKHLIDLRCGSFFTLDLSSEGPEYKEYSFSPTPYDEPILLKCVTNVELPIFNLI